MVHSCCCRRYSIQETFFSSQNVLLLRFYYLSLWPPKGRTQAECDPAPRWDSEPGKMDSWVQNDPLTLDNEIPQYGANSTGHEILFEILTICVILPGGFFCHVPVLCMSEPLMLQLVISAYPFEMIFRFHLDLLRYT